MKGSKPNKRKKNRRSVIEAPMHSCCNASMLHLLNVFSKDKGTVVHSSCGARCSLGVLAQFFPSREQRCRCWVCFTLRDLRDGLSEARGVAWYTFQEPDWLQWLVAIAAISCSRLTRDYRCMTWIRASWRIDTAARWQHAIQWLRSAFKRAVQRFLVLRTNTAFDESLTFILLKHALVLLPPEFQSTPKNKNQERRAAFTFSTRSQIKSGHVIWSRLWLSLHECKCSASNRAGTNRKHPVTIPLCLRPIYYQSK